VVYLEALHGSYANIELNPKEAYQTFFEAKKFAISIENIMKNKSEILRVLG
jgi:hypothetical protein